MRAILAAMLLMFATVAYTHDGPAKEHAAAMVFDQSNNTMHIFRGPIILILLNTQLSLMQR